ncbi:MAG: glycosyltransferase family 2 protein [Leptospiraceae bacterium]|nr:glycosyltransferase family 2 protein [Leptospiraceae bacterium]MCP5510414.1 glycosyltransferase family 2 protein [Leptospiraceae bacterium]
MKKKFLVVVPIFNEEDKIQSVVEETINHSDSFADLLLVNDGSTDNSSFLLEKMKSKYPNIHLIQKPKNEGYGASLISGMKFSKDMGYEFFITMDCDEQHQPEDLVRFRNEDTSYDLVSGSRYLPESGIQGISAPPERVEINRRITTLLSKRYDWKITDSFCGYKRYRTRAFPAENFLETGYAAPMELWSYVKMKNLSWKEIPVDRIYITDSRSFGEDLDKKRKRYHYYLKIFYSSEKRFQMD